MALTYITETSENIIAHLKKQGFHLSFEDREYIRKEINDAIIDTAEYESNGCDCGQMSCPICS